MSIGINHEGLAVSGMNYSLLCDILGVELSDLNVTFNWTKSTSLGDLRLLNVEGSSSNLLFSTLSMSDAGNYRCIALFEDSRSLSSSSELTIQCKE